MYGIHANLKQEENACVCVYVCLCFGIIIFQVSLFHTHKHTHVRTHTQRTEQMMVTMIKILSIWRYCVVAVFLCAGLAMAFLNVSAPQSHVTGSPISPGEAFTPNLDSSIVK